MRGNTVPMKLSFPFVSYMSLECMTRRRRAQSNDCCMKESITSDVWGHGKCLVSAVNIHGYCSQGYFSHVGS